MSDIDLSPGQEARVALITGAARGIGAASARLLVEQGWKVVLFDLCGAEPALSYPLARKADLDALAAELGGDSKVRTVIGDVRIQSDLEAAVAVAVEQFGGLDAAVAAAGVVGGGAPVWESDDDLWKVVLDVNLNGVYRTAKAAIPAMLARTPPRSGRFVAVASAAASVGTPFMAAYAASKAGVTGLVRSMAAELGWQGITVNAVAPGSTETDLLKATASIYGLDSTDEFISHNIIPSLLQPDEIAALCAWLCSPSSSGLTGAVLAVDSGMTAR